MNRPGQKVRNMLEKILPTCESLNRATMNPWERPQNQEFINSIYKSANSDLWWPMVTDGDQGYFMVTNDDQWWPRICSLKSSYVTSQKVIEVPLRSCGVYLHFHPNFCKRLLTHNKNKSIHKNIHKWRILSIVWKSEIMHQNR